MTSSFTTNYLISCCSSLCIYKEKKKVLFTAVFMLRKKKLTILFPELHKSFYNFIVIKWLGNHGAEYHISYLIYCISYFIQSIQCSPSIMHMSSDDNFKKHWTQVFCQRWAIVTKMLQNMKENYLTLWQTKKSRIRIINRCFRQWQRL